MEEGVTINWAPNPFKTKVMVTPEAALRMRENISAEEEKEWTEHLCKCYISALTDEHDGDCTNQSSSCIKCHAEDHLGINTIPGASSSARYYAQKAFREVGNLDGAIHWLKTSETIANWDGWEECAERWKREKQEAAKWLMKYKEDHGF